MMPEHLAWLAKSTVRHGNKIPYVSRVTPFTTIITDTKLRPFNQQCADEKNCKPSSCPANQRRMVYA